MKKSILGILVLPLLAAPAMAASVTRCTDSPTVADPVNAMQPVAKYSRSFSGGAIRVTEMDTEEPACCSKHLMVQSPAGAGKKGPPACNIVGDRKNIGFSGIDFAKLASSYDPGKGVLLTFPIRIYDLARSDGSSKPGMVKVRINSATGSVVIEQ